MSGIPSGEQKTQAGHNSWWFQPTHLEIWVQLGHLLMGNWCFFTHFEGPKIWEWYGKLTIQVIQSALFIPSWRSLNALKGSLNHHKKVTLKSLNHQDKGVPLLGVPGITLWLDSICWNPCFRQDSVFASSRLLLLVIAMGCWTTRYLEKLDWELHENLCWNLVEKRTPMSRAK